MNFREISRIVELDRMSGPCEDDYEVKAPYIDRLCNESFKEDGSILDFSKDDSHHRDEYEDDYYDADLD